MIRCRKMASHYARHSCKLFAVFSLSLAHSHGLDSIHKRQDKWRRGESRLINLEPEMMHKRPAASVRLLPSRACRRSLGALALLGGESSIFPLSPAEGCGCTVLHCIVEQQLQTEAARE
uniref:Putative secreted protein n=1 Tax=Anopheles darlingi TaxID=43151 RepID=A0A2M4D7M8_ANODA